MTNPFLLLVLLSTVVLSDVAGPCYNNGGPDGCSFEESDVDPNSCSCWICVAQPKDNPNMRRPFNIDSQHLGRGEAYPHDYEMHFPYKPNQLIGKVRQKFKSSKDHPVNTQQLKLHLDAIYADPIKMLLMPKTQQCPAMSNHRDHVQSNKIKKPISFSPTGKYQKHRTYRKGEQMSNGISYNGKEFEWPEDYPLETPKGGQMYVPIAGVAGLFYQIDPPKGQTLEGGYTLGKEKNWYSAWDVVANPEKPNTPHFFTRESAEIPKDNPCRKGQRKKSFALCTYCFSIHSMRTLFTLYSLYSVRCPLCFISIWTTLEIANYLIR